MIKKVVLALLIIGLLVSLTYNVYLHRVVNLSDDTFAEALNDRYRKILSNSDLVIKGKPVRIIEKKIIGFGSSEVTAKMPCNIYEVTVTDSIKNPQKAEKIKLALVDLSNLSITTSPPFRKFVPSLNTTYVFCLKKSKDSNALYVIESYEDGMYIVEDGMKIKSYTTDQILDYRALKRVYKAILDRAGLSDGN